MLIFLEIFIVCCIFIIGTLFGSFFSLATYRLPRKQDIVSSRSYCPKCKHRLEFFDLIPIFSYIFHLGKCKYCKEKISIRYLLLETCNGLLFVLLYYIFGYTIYFLIIVVIYIALVLLIGSKIMKNKMTQQEIQEANELSKKLKEEKETKKANKKQNNKINKKKSGVFLIELVIAMALLLILLMSSYMLTRNYDSKKNIAIARANAVSIAAKNINIALATDYDKLNSFENEETIDEIVYSVDTSVYNYSDENFEKKNIVKKITVKVNYSLNGSPYNFELSTLKGKGR